MSGALAKAHAHGIGVSSMPSLAVRLGLDSGVRRLLETPLVINGASPLVGSFCGFDAGATTWVSRDAAPITLTEAGAGTDTDLAQVSPYLGPLDLGVKFNGTGVAGATGRIYQAASTDTLLLGTKDLALEFLAVTTPAAGVLYATRQAGNDDFGYAGFFSGTAWLAGLYLNSATRASMTSGAFSPGELHLIHAFYDRSGSGQLYVNGVASGVAVSLAGVVGDIANKYPFALGAYALGNAYAFSSRLFLWQAWMGEAWLNSHLQATVAAQRLALLTASRPAFSVVPSTYPSSAGSTSPVYQQRRLSDGTDRLFYMGAGSPCFDRVVDAAGRAVVAHLVEVAGVNSALQSQVAGTTWTVVDAAIAASNSDTAPDGTLTADTLTASAANGYLRQTFGTITAVQRTYSHWVRRNGAANVAGQLQIVKTSDASVVAHVHFTATATWQLVQVSGTCVVNDTEIRLAIDTNAESLYVWQADFTADAYAGSPIVTTTAAVTRAASVAKWAATSCFPRAEGTVIGAILARSFTPTRARVLFSISDGSVDNEVQIFTTATTGLLSASSRKAAGTSGDVVLTASGSVYTNAIIPVMVAWRQNQLDLWARISGVWVRAQDLTVDAVAGATFTTFAAGSDGAGANQCGPGAYWLAGWQAFPQFISDPSAVRSGVDTLWSSL